MKIEENTKYIYKQGTGFLFKSIDLTGIPKKPKKKKRKK